MIDSIQVGAPGGSHILRRRQVVPGTLEEVFAFFESPSNLEEITPPWLRFEVLSSTDASVRTGTLITYRLRWLGVPMRWLTRIAEFEPNVMFADEMRSGPYRSWYHRHFFRASAEGVEVEDVVVYELPFGWIGRLVHAAIIRPQLERIFDYRRDAVARSFAATTARSQ